MKADLKTLTANLDALSETIVRNDSAKIRTFYHRLLMKCAARMSVADFAKAIEAAEAPEERYQAGPLADDIEEARR